MLSLHFVGAGKLDPEASRELSRPEQVRAEADYSRFFLFTEHAPGEELATAEAFCARAAAFLDAAGFKA